MEVKGIFFGCQGFLTPRMPPVRGTQGALGPRSSLEEAGEAPTVELVPCSDLLKIFSSY
jgi:hypothetical protein